MLLKPEWRRLVLVAAIVLIALLLRLQAAFLLPVDFDEPTYLRVAVKYAAALQAGDVWQVAWLDDNLEHPALVKLLYGLELAAFMPAIPVEEKGGIGADVESEIALQLARGLSVVFGTGQVLLLALLNPLAGVALAVHTLTIKYTSQAYLEAVPGFLALLAVVAFERYRTSAPVPHRHGEGPGDDTSPLLIGEGPGVRWGWLLLSAVALGAAAAGKYTCMTAGLAILPFLIIAGWQTGWKPVLRPWRVVAVFTLVALTTFLILDPTLWPDPVGRLLRSLSFHPAYSASSQVTRYSYPWWKPLDYLSQSVPWHPGVFLVSWDSWIFALGLLGLPFLWRRRRLYVVWFLVGMAVLFLWPTKWPQYALIVTPALCLSLGEGILTIARWLNERFDLSDYLQPFAIPKSAWVVAGLFVIAFVAIFFVGAFSAWQSNLGWQQINRDNSGLISDRVQALAFDAAGRLWVGTGDGLARFDGQAWAGFTAGSGALPGDDVRALAVASDDTLWVGTTQGLAAFDGARWRRFPAGPNGPVGDDIRGLATTPAGGLWVATTTGLSFFDGQTWTTYRATDGGIPSDLVLAVALDQAGRLWLGTNQGAAVIHPNHPSPITRYDPSNSGLQWPAVATIAIGPDGRVWLGTLGGGIAVFDGQRWQTLTVANSGLPWNTIIALAVGPQGEVWLAADQPITTGGNVARWDGQRWQTFTPYNSGIARGSGVCFTFDRAGHVWIGMRHSGLSVYSR